MQIEFDCLECGHCCRNLLKKVEGKIVGLSLSPSEAKLFPRELLIPEMGAGRKSSRKPKTILSYRLNSEVCPHLSDNNRCKIYERRPLTCQAFPLITMGPIGTTVADADGCKFVEKFEKKYGTMEQYFPLIPENFKAKQEWDAVQRINRRIMSGFKKLRKRDVLFRYDMKNKKWIPYM